MVYTVTTNNALLPSIGFKQKGDELTPAQVAILKQKQFLDPLVNAKILATSGAEQKAKSHKSLKTENLVE